MTPWNLPYGPLHYFTGSPSRWQESPDLGEIFAILRGVVGVHHYLTFSQVPQHNTHSIMQSQVFKADQPRSTRLALKCKSSAKMYFTGLLGCQFILQPCISGGHSLLSINCCNRFFMASFTIHPPLFLMEKLYVCKWFKLEFCIYLHLMNSSPDTLNGKRIVYNMYINNTIFALKLLKSTLRLECCIPLYMQNVFTI